MLQKVRKNTKFPPLFPDPCQNFIRLFVCELSGTKWEPWCFVTFGIESESVYEGKMTFLLQELDNMRKTGITEKEDHWNSHIDCLISDHNKALRQASELVKDLQQVLEGNDSFKVQVHTLSLSE